MHALSAAELLGTWERGLTQAPVDRALELLAAVYPDTSRNSLATLSVGRRDARLLRLRELLFGPRMAGSVSCPSCGGHLELTLDVADLLAGSPSEPEEEMAFTAGGYDLRCRLPNSEDLAAAAGHGDVTATQRMLLGRCLLSASVGDTPATSDPLPQQIIEAASERMAKADPLADIQVAVSCPDCKHHWRLAFDIVSFLWSEIEVWVCRVLREVHTLASAYGWSERDILALSPARRRFYLEMVGA